MRLQAFVTSLGLDWFTLSCTTTAVRSAFHCARRPCAGDPPRAVQHLDVVLRDATENAVQAGSPVGGWGGSSTRRERLAASADAIGVCRSLEAHAGHSPPVSGSVSRLRGARARPACAGARPPGLFFARLHALIDRLRDYPVLIVWGMKDIAFQPSQLARWEQHLPHAECIASPSPVTGPTRKRRTRSSGPSTRSSRGPRQFRVTCAETASQRPLRRAQRPCTAPSRRGRPAVV